MPLGTEVGLSPGHIVLDGDPALLPQRGKTLPHFSAHACCGQTAGWIKMLLGREVDLGPGHIVFDGYLPPKKERDTNPPSFRPMSIVAKRSPISATSEHLLYNKTKERPHKDHINWV